MLHLVTLVVSATVIVAAVNATSDRTASISPQASGTPKKTTLSAAQRKLNTKLLDEIDLVRRQTTGESGQPVPRQRGGVRLDDRHRALVDIRAPITGGLTSRIDTLGGTIVSSSQRYDSTVAWIPLLMLERLAADDAIRSIYPASEAALQ
jgi:hypothetical protein